LKDEAILVEQLKNPKTKNLGFNTLVSLYKERLYWHIRKIVISHDDAHDVLQNTFIKVFKHVDGFNQKSKLFSWLYRIATNESISFLNKKAKKRSLSIEDYQHELASTLSEDEHFTATEIQLILQKRHNNITT
jgi:DNA-directed RNA polymerase specialized sigma subunit, sigma24 homolog